MASTSVSCNVNGNSVSLKVIIAESVGRISWVIRMYSSVDQGKGGDTGLADYPYFVENINGTTNPYPDSYSTSRTYSKAGNYLAELALSGYGVQDQCAYTIGGSPPPSGGTMTITQDTLFIYVHLSNVTEPGQVNIFEQTSGKRIWVSSIPRTGTWTETIPRNILTVDDYYHFFLWRANGSLIGTAQFTQYLFHLIVTLLGVSWKNPELSTSAIVLNINVQGVGTGLTDISIDGTFWNFNVYPGLKYVNFTTPTPIQTNKSYYICIRGICLTLAAAPQQAQGYNCGACNTPVNNGTYPTTTACNTGCNPPQTCALMTRPLVTTSTPTTTEDGQFTFTSIAMGGVMTGDGMRHVVKLGNIQIFDSGVGQSASITKTITLPSTVVAGGYQLTTTVSDGCVTNGVKTPQTMTSQTFYVIITGRLTQGYNCGACTTPVSNGTYPTPLACNTGCVTPPPTGTKWDCTDSCAAAHTTGRFDSQSSCATGCNVTPPPATGGCNPACNPDTEMCLFGTCYKKNTVYMIGVGLVLVMAMR